MYDKYYLSEKQIHLIETWSLNKPLFIYGPPGVGKTSLAKDILKDTSLTIIDSSHIKHTNDMFSYLLNIIQKRNITLMFEQQKNRGLIIDNLDIFNKHDKKNFKSIINLLLTYEYYGTKIIVIFDDKLIKNRNLSKINSTLFYLNYTKQVFNKITHNILIQKKKESSFNYINSLLIKSNYNLHGVHSLINYSDNLQTNPLDNFDSNEILFKKLITEKMNCSEILRIFIGEETILSLNLLENIYDYIHDLDIIIQIYKYFVIGDKFDIFSIIQHEYGFKNYSCILKIFHIHLAIKNISHVNYKSFIYNKYISRSLIQTHSHKLNYNYISKYKIMIHMVLFGISNHINLKNLKNIKKDIKNINKKEMEYYIKSFNYVYNSKIKIKEIYK